MKLTIDNFNWSGQKVLIRVDFNVPLNEKFEITDDTRIRAALPTIKKILSDGGSVILMSHLGRPKKGAEEKFSLKHLVLHLSELTRLKVKFTTDCIGAKTKEIAGELKPGEILLLENLRFHKEEEAGDENFAAQLAALGNIYVNDAFGTAHRAHASTSIMAKFFPKEKKMFGYLMSAELTNADKILKNAQKPFTAIIGGAKVSDKILIIEELLEKADNLIIGGGMAYTFFKALGGATGKSLVENDKLDLAKNILQKAKQKNVNLLLPSDSIVADNFSNEANTKITASNNIEEGWMGLDIGENACRIFSETILNSKTILWNGPMGVFEMKKFAGGTRAVAQAVAESTQRGAFSLVGGGDSVAAVNQLGLADCVSYVSTGGGAMLEYFEGKILPGVKAMED